VLIGSDFKHGLSPRDVRARSWGLQDPFSGLWAARVCSKISAPERSKVPAHHNSLCRSRSTHTISGYF